MPRPLKPDLNSLLLNCILMCSLSVPLGSCRDRSGVAEQRALKVEWAGHSLREVTSLRELPPAVQSTLGVGIPGLDGIANRGESYNPTDVVDSRLPMRRFVVAGLDADTALVAVEHGGFGWRVEVTAFADIQRKPIPEREWTLFETPTSLRDLAGRLGTK